MESKINDAVACFKDGFNCSQAILSAYCEEFGLDKKTALQISCGLGAGMGRLQETCGAVSGAYLLIGLKYGKFLKDDEPAKEQTYAFIQEFAKRFCARNGTTNCRALLGVDLIHGSKQAGADRVKTVCPKMVSDAAEILEDMLFSENDSNNKGESFMSERPDLDKKLDSATFQSYYYLKDELVLFCRQEGLQTTGGKTDLTKRIAHFLDTGEGLVSKQKSKASANIGVITEDTAIESDFVCSEKHRAFFKEKIGKRFSFNVSFQNWLKSNAGKTYRDAIEAYHRILADKKKTKTTIDKQFEYNTYIRDFFADNKGKNLNDAIRCWKYKKSIQGHNRYEKSDLIALTQF